MEQSLGKIEKLKSSLNIQELFTRGNRIKKYPVQLIFLEVSGTHTGNKVAFSVPKKLVKKAVERNKIKRRLREVYRKNKQISHLENRSFHMIIIFYGKETFTYASLESCVTELLRRLAVFQADA